MTTANSLQQSALMLFDNTASQGLVSPFNVFLFQPCEALFNLQPDAADTGDLYMEINMYIISEISLIILQLVAFLTVHFQTT